MRVSCSWAVWDRSLLPLPLSFPPLHLVAKWRCLPGLQRFVAEVAASLPPLLQTAPTWSMTCRFDVGLATSVRAFWHICSATKLWRHRLRGSIWSFWWHSTIRMPQSSTAHAPYLVMYGCLSWLNHCKSPWSNYLFPQLFCPQNSKSCITQGCTWEKSAKRHAASVGQDTGAWPRRLPHCAGDLNAEECREFLVEPQATQPD